jgi:methionyl-tRNA formyltransferase
MAVAELKFLVAGYGMPAEFALNSLFAQGVPPAQVALLTHDEDARNRGLHEVARLRGLRMSTSPAKAPITAEWVAAFAPDVLISMHYRSLIPKIILDQARLGGVNLHPSLLPLYRGTNSVAWVIVNGESETGFTFHRMDAKFDTGAILIQERLPITATDTAFSLFHRQIVRAMCRFEEVVDMMVCGEPGTLQPAEGTYYPRKLPHEGKIDIAWPLAQVDRFIRAMQFPPFDPAVVEYGGEIYHVHSISDYLALTEKLGLRRKFA